MVNRLLELGYDVVRIAGRNRIETASKIAMEVGASSGKAIVAYSHNFPDALAVASYAAREGVPIFLTSTNSLHETTRKILSRS